MVRHYHIKEKLSFGLISRKTCFIDKRIVKVELLLSYICLYIRFDGPAGEDSSGSFYNRNASQRSP